MWCVDLKVTACIDIAYRYIVYRLYRYSRCSIVIEELLLVKLLFVNYRLCMCIVLIKMLLLANYRSCRCRLVVVMLLHVIDCRLCG